MDRFRGEAQTKQNLAAPRPLGNQFVRWSRLANQGLCDGNDLLTLRSAREQGLPTDLEESKALTQLILVTIHCPHIVNNLD